LPVESTLAKCNRPQRSRRGRDAPIKSDATNLTVAVSYLQIA